MLGKILLSNIFKYPEFDFFIQLPFTSLLNEVIYRFTSIDHIFLKDSELMVVVL